MKIRRCVLLLLLWTFLGILPPVIGHTADTDRQVLNALLTELEQKIEKADERKMASPNSWTNSGLPSNNTEPSSAWFF
jgi:hypothetical protein